MVLVADFFTHSKSEKLLNDIATIYLSLEDERLQQRPRTTTRGQPCIEISQEQLSMLLAFDFKIASTANMLQVSSETYGLEEAEDADFGAVSDSQLDHITQQFVTNHPHCGERSFDGYLRQMGLRIQRHRLRRLHRVDSRGVTKSSSSKGILCSWFIDGHRKLVGWHIVVHGGIDGFSRLPVYLECQLIIH